MRRRIFFVLGFALFFLLMGQLQQARAATFQCGQMTQVCKRADGSSCFGGQQGCTCINKCQGVGVYLDCHDGTLDCFDYGPNPCVTSNNCNNIPSCRTRGSSCTSKTCCKGAPCSGGRCGGTGDKNDPGPQPCPQPAPPTTSVGEQNCPGDQWLGWSDEADQGVRPRVRYAGRLDDGQNDWNGDCSNPNPGDACWGVDDNKALIGFQAGHSYTWWVHAVNSCSSWSEAYNYPMDIVDPSRGPATIDVDTNFGGTVQPGVRTVRWDSVEVVNFYLLRIDEGNNGLGSSCSDGTGSDGQGDECFEPGGTTHNYNFVAGRSYNIWVHSFVCGTVSGAASVFVSVPPPDSAPFGTFDSASCTRFSGWACDADNWGQPLDVHFYRDGPAGSGTIVGATTANVNRPDVAAAGVCGGTGVHGFEYTPSSADAGLFNGSPHNIYTHALGVDSGGAQNGNNPVIGGSPISITCAPPPTPTPVAWYKLKDTSLQSKGTINSTIPNPSKDYDTGAVVSRYLIDGAAGIVSALGINVGTGTVSLKNWYTNNSYNPSTSLTKDRFMSYVKSRKQHKVVTGTPAQAASQITANGIYIYRPSGTLDLNAFVAPIAAGKNIVLIVDGDATFTSSFNVGGAKFGAIAILADNITASLAVNAIDNTILVANTFNTGAGDGGLKITGNLIVTTTGGLTNGRTQNASANNKPSLYVVNTAKTYIDLLPWLSTTRFEWKQLQ